MKSSRSFSTPTRNAEAARTTLALQPPVKRKVLELSWGVQPLAESVPAREEAPNPYRQLDLRELIRRCRTLTHQERTAMRLLLAGRRKTQLAEVLKVSPARITAICKKAFAKLRVFGEQQVEKRKAALENEARYAFWETTQVYIYRKPRHCPEGKERCKRTGICPFATR